MIKISLKSEDIAFAFAQCVTVPKMLNDTDTDTFSGTKYFRYRYRYFFRYQIFSDTGSETFSGTKFYRYRFRDFFPVPNFSDTGSDTTRKNEKFPVPVPVPIINLLNSKNLATKISSGTKFFRDRFQDFFQYQIFLIPVRRVFPVLIFSNTGSDSIKKK